MPIKVTCDQCKKSYRVPSERAGKKVRCASCGHIFLIPEQDEIPLIELEEVEAGKVSGVSSQIRDSNESSDDDDVGDDDYADNDDGPVARLHSMSISEAIEFGKRKIKERRFDEAVRPLAYATANSLSPEARSLLQDAMKLQYPLVFFVRSLGLRPPWSTDLGIAKSYIIGGAVVCGVATAIVRKAKHVEAFQNMALWMLAGILCAMCVARIVDYIATLTVRRLANGHLAVTVGDSVGAGIGIGWMILAGTFGCLFASTQSLPLAGAAILAYASAKGVHLICKTPTVMGACVVGVVFLCLLTAGIIGIVGIAKQSTPGDLNQRIPGVPGVLLLSSFLCISFMRPVHAIINEFVGTQPNTLDDQTFATRPGKLSLSNSKLRKLHPEVFGLRSLFFRLTHSDLGVSAKDARWLVRQAIHGGDAQPAMVVTTEPFIIAAYSDEIDDVVLLEFSNDIARDMHLARGNRMVSINTYGPMEEKRIAPDIRFGPDSSRAWGNVHPQIANLLSDDVERLRELEKAIRPREWDRLKERLHERLARPDKPRIGKPLYCHVARAIYEGEVVMD